MKGKSALMAALLGGMLDSSRDAIYQMETNPHIPNREPSVRMPRKKDKSPGSQKKTKQTRKRAKQARKKNR